jgi:hypothetical protein
MSAISLVFDGQSDSVPRESVSGLFEHRRIAADEQTYVVQSCVPIDAFKTLVGSLQTQTKISVTRENALSLLPLAKEFFLSELASECAAFPVSVDPFVTLSDRVYELERQISLLLRFQGEIESQKEGLEHLRLAVEELKASLEQFSTEKPPNSARLLHPTPPGAKTQPTSKLPLPKPHPAPKLPSLRPQPSTEPHWVEMQMKVAKSLDGIISFLTQTNGGNVHVNGLVTITSKSVSDDPRFALTNTADLDSDAFFESKDEPGQWVCWDFLETRLHPTRYTISSIDLKSWVIEASLDGETWIEIHRQTADQAGSNVASFACSHEAGCRFIRLTQIDVNPVGGGKAGGNALRLRAVEFFGTLLEFERPPASRMNAAIGLDLGGQFDAAIDAYLALTVADCGSVVQFDRSMNRVVKLTAAYREQRLVEVVNIAAKAFMNANRCPSLARTLEEIKAYPDAHEIYKMARMWEDAARLAQYLEPDEQIAFQREYALHSTHA